VARPKGHLPAYYLHKSSGQARVIINHEHIYLGKYGSAESHEQYFRLISELSSVGSTTSTNTAKFLSISVNELILNYWRYAQSYYIKNDKPTPTLEGIRAALRPLRTLYGQTLAGEFSPKKLKAVRQRMIESGLSRGVINSRVGKIKRLFKWAVAEELTPPSVLYRLQSVAGLAGHLKRVLI
jgi:hypothetical protein